MVDHINIVDETRITNQKMMAEEWVPTNGYKDCYCRTKNIVIVKLKTITIIIRILVVATVSIMMLLF